MDSETLRSHIQAKHEKSPTTEPFPCELCGLVLATFNLLKEHVDKHHPSGKTHCQYCDFCVEDEEAFQSHIVESHSEVVIMHNLAKQMDHLSDGFAQFENFKSEFSEVLKSLFDNQHMIEQELFVLRNNLPNNNTTD